MPKALKGYMDKKAVAQVLEQIAAFLELKSENPFRIRAFRTAARAVAGFPGDLRESLEDGSLAAAKGIGPATLQIVTELVSTGRASMLEELREQIPPGLVEMLEISGLGVAKIRQIHEVLGIDSLPELEAAAHDGRLAKLPRFGQRTSENILKAIAFLRQASAFRLSHHAADEAEGLRAALERLPGVHQRDHRRRRPPPLRGGQGSGHRAGGRVVAGGAVQAPEPAARGARVCGQDERRLTLRFAGGASAQIVATTPVNAGAVLVQATGSEAHLRRAGRARGRQRVYPERRRALARQRVRGHPRRGDASTRRSGCSFIPPELREGMGEVEPPAQARAAAAGERQDSRDFSTATPATPTAPTRSRSWRSPAGPRATSTSASPITARPRPTPADSGRTISPARPTRSTRSTRGSKASGC